MGARTLHVVGAMAGKDLLLLWRDRTGFFFVFGFPLLIAVFFGIVFSGPAGRTASPTPVAVVDLDGSEGSGRLVARLMEADELQAERAGDAESATSLVRAGKRAAAIVIEPGFGAVDVRARLVGGSGAGGDAAGVRVAIDPSRRAEAGMIRGVVLRHAIAALLRAPAETGDGDGFAPVAVTIAPVEAARRNAFLVTFPQGLVWGVMACAAGFGVSLVTERRAGTLLRLRAGPISAWTVLAGKALACFAGIVGLSVVLLSIGGLGVGLLADARVWALVAAVVSVAAGFVGVMMFVAVSGRTEAAAGGIGWAVLLVMAMLGGAMAPRFLMPPWLSTVGALSPVRWAIDAYEGALWRGWGAAEMAAPCVKLLALGAALFALGAWVTARRD